MAAGRKEGRVVRSYLEALRRNKPRRGRKRTAASVEKRLAEIERELPDTDALSELRLIQERRDLQAELETMGAETETADLEQEFIEIAARYSERQGIAYVTWRDMGVSPDVLSRAGISRRS